MHEFIKELLKHYKDDLEENNFNNILLHCPPMLMQELLDVFALANIDVPKSNSKIYADVCCFLLTYFREIALLNIEWAYDYELFTFRTSNNLTKEPQQFRDSLNSIGAEVAKIEQDYNGIHTVVIRIWNWSH